MSPTKKDLKRGWWVEKPEEPKPVAVPVKSEEDEESLEWSNRGRKYRLPGQVCAVCFLSTQDERIIQILNNENLTAYKKHEEINRIFPEWGIKYNSVRVHIVNNHKDRDYLTNKGKRDYERLEIMAALKAQGMEQMKLRKQEVPPEMLLKIMKLEQEEKERLQKEEKEKPQMKLMHQLFLRAMYGSPAVNPDANPHPESWADYWAATLY